MAGTRTNKTTGASVRDDRRKRRNSKSQRPVPVRFWLTIGIVAGVLTFVMSGQSNTGAQESGQQDVASQHVQEKKEPVFDFYKVLPELEVVVDGIKLESEPKPKQKLVPVIEEHLVTQVIAPDRASASQNQEPQNPVLPKDPPVAGSELAAVSPQSGSTSEYLLQAGSFRETGDADRMRGELLLNGFESHIQSVAINGHTWYRVHVGPFASKQLAETTRAELAELGMAAIVKQHK